MGTLDKFLNAAAMVFITEIRRTHRRALGYEEACIPRPTEITENLQNTFAAEAGDISWRIVKKNTWSHVPSAMEMKIWFPSKTESSGVSHLILNLPHRTATAQNPPHRLEWNPVVYNRTYKVPSGERRATFSLLASRLEPLSLLRRNIVCLRSLKLAQMKTTILICLPLTEINLEVWNIQGKVSQPIFVQPVPLSRFPTWLCFPVFILSSFLDFTEVGYPDCSDTEFTPSSLAKWLGISLPTYVRLFCSPIVNISLFKTEKLLYCLPLPWRV